MLDNYVVQIRKGTKKITLQRFLTSKIAYGKDFSIIELAALFSNQLWLQQKAASDSTFSEKFGSDLEKLTKILKESNFSRGLTKGALTSMKTKLLVQDWDFLIPQRNFSTVEAHLKDSIFTRWRKPEGVELSRLPPKKHIGMGYRDKGTAKRPEVDANPAWQEVASASASLERQIQEHLERGKEIVPGNTQAELEWTRRAQELREAYERITDSGRNSRDAKDS